ncbi:hypothetical protein, partial [Pseudomaricurvus sp.]|uniref:hypothetical protein n=1 Tax=Pseudomaricurvus sp. TaxID=2004510 RepID=UPI003F6AAB4F
ETQTSFDVQNPLFETETVQLQNRLSRLVDVKLRCFAYNNRYCVILVASQRFPARQLNNSAEHLAYQLVQRLNVAPEDVDFIQYQPGEEPEWLRWRFQWVGTSPLQAKSLPLSSTSLESFVMPILAEGEMFSLIAGSVPAVA